MINDRNHTKYFLYFGTNDEQDLSHMKQAMWKADPGGGQVFSDRTNLTEVRRPAVGRRGTCPPGTQIKFL